MYSDLFHLSFDRVTCSPEEAKIMEAIPEFNVTSIIPIRTYYPSNSTDSLLLDMAIPLDMVAIKLDNNTISVALKIKGCKTKTFTLNSINCGRSLSYTTQKELLEGQYLALKKRQDILKASKK